MHVFISYSHQQSDWVCQRLAPCLEAGGADVLIDKDRFQIGKAVVGQMDALQDSAERHLLVLSPEYLSSDYCLHEMQRAIKLDPKFDKGLVLPVRRVDCALPKAFTGWNPPLYAKLIDDRQPEPWNALLRECGANGLGTDAPAWLEARDEIVELIGRGQSVNLVTQGEPNWRGLLTHLRRGQFPEMGLVNLEDPDTTSRRGLLAAMAKALGGRAPLPIAPDDLAGFKSLLENLAPSKLILTHFDLASHRAYYDVDLFSTLRYLIMEMRKLTLLIQSRTPFGALLPRDHPLSDMDIKTVELRGLK